MTEILDQLDAIVHDDMEHDDDAEDAEDVELQDIVVGEAVEIIESKQS